MQWIEEGEKPSSFFLNMETKHFINKTIPKLVNEKGETICKQDKILEEAKNYYKKLYTKTESLSEVNLNSEIPDSDIKKLNDTLKESLEGEITYNELTTAMRRMKNEKSPGSDGFTNEFF